MGDLVCLKELELYDVNELSALPQAISRLSALRRLTWINRNIRDVSGIAHLKGLRSLRLDTQEYQAMTGTTFQSTSSSPGLQGLIHCTGLRVLELLGCAGLLGDLGWLAELTALRKLEVWSDHMRELPANIGALKRLERVCFEKGHFKALPSSFGVLKSVRDLRIESSVLEELPASLACFTQLTHLSLSLSSNFNAASMNLGSVTSLQTLFISGCLLPGIPEDLGSLPNLTSLYIKCKPVKSLLPHGFPSLQDLDISGSLHFDVPGLVARSEAGQLTAEDYPCLRVLTIKFWEADFLPDALGHLQHLENLELTHGDFRQLPQTLSSLRNLSRLHLQDCKNLTSIPATMGSISSLNRLCVHKCDSFDLVSLTGRLKEVYVP